MSTYLPVSLKLIDLFCSNLSEENACLMKSSLWRLPPLETDDQTETDLDEGSCVHHSSSSPLERLCDLDTAQYGKELKVSAFHPSDESRVMSIVDNYFLLFDVGESSPQASV